MSDIVWTMSGATALVTFILAFALMFWDLGCVVWGVLKGKDVEGTVSAFIVGKVGPLSPVTVFVIGAAVSHLFWYMLPAQCTFNTGERVGYALCGAVIGMSGMWVYRKIKGANK